MSNLTLRTFIEHLQDVIATYPDAADRLVALSRDPEGNGFNLVSAGLVSFGTIGEVYGSPKVAEELEGKPVVTIWPGYPEFVEEPEDD